MVVGMAIGDVVDLEFRSFRDEVTGIEVTCLSDGFGNTMHPYFTQNFMDRAGRKILCVSDRTGWWQIYLLNLEEESMIQLSEDAFVRPHAPCLSYDGRVAYYWDGWVLKAVDTESLQGRTLYMTPNGFDPTILSITPDGRYLAFAYSESIPQSVLKGRIYSGQLERMYLRPRSVVMRFDLVKEEAEPLWGECEWISHVNISPVDPDIVLFCHEGPWHLVQRMWIVKASTHEVYPLLRQERYVERAGHEFFTESGRVATQFSRRESPNSKNWVFYDAYLNVDGSGLKMFKYRYAGPGHMHSRNERFSVGDRAFTDNSKEGRAFIGLTIYEGEEAIVKRICKHDSSWQTQNSHPHPVITPDNKNVVFSSDRKGRCNLYMVPIEA
ncbi:MAG: oligogalacturonate lyase family protein [Nitrososphaerota archaeon]|nr:oligogalacturonate lyase family protein [Candidatus Bathyarchaeota archaeon]MDW8049087.1 oligogalacturonate lyase family protein [Nitrososphaerota archaeon]